MHRISLVSRSRSRFYQNLQHCVAFPPPPPPHPAVSALKASRKPLLSVIGSMATHVVLKSVSGHTSRVAFSVEVATGCFQNYGVLRSCSATSRSRRVKTPSAEDTPVQRDRRGCPGGSTARLLRGLVSVFQCWSAVSWMLLLMLDSKRARQEAPHSPRYSAHVLSDSSNRRLLSLVNAISSALFVSPSSSGSTATN